MAPGFCGRSLRPRRLRCRELGEPSLWGWGLCGRDRPARAPLEGLRWGPAGRREGLRSCKGSGCYSTRPSVEIWVAVRASRFLPTVMLPRSAASAAFSPPSHQFRCGGRRIQTSPFGQSPYSKVGPALAEKQLCKIHRKGFLSPFPPAQ